MKILETSKWFLMSRISIRELTSPRLALDLVEVFFQIVHTRLPLLNPAQFRSRLSLSSRNNTTKDSPVNDAHGKHKTPHPALVASILAWGAKFAENPLFVADRQRNGGTQSLFAKTLVNRARDLAEALKVHRVASTEHVVIALLIEPLQSRELFSVYVLQVATYSILETPDDPNGIYDIRQFIPRTQ
jgi:hypothetical protein